ncbi:sigma54 specific transcriptional regulator, Fis family [Paracidovorax avenae ATCC 19860]|uniref:Sigma54 specific transcriptional regulator, Fis family n=1 Tax=Paracidovorax avenae (strain ATCC 19860 / DSM 7227 / CCUG 15838 / JCM 20985 / LMG 2117 / NCPPB 1011) TaxID=643561 RepID=F0Q8Z9_PARA1|nr:sigma-54-dependent Fis family transcriptional regulator [Paracidovorax avenae]ADX45930.1 sigma54 specific transcriptional regulator, Fis family [Paracidovorax avenae ATCC 19860]
MQSSLHGGEAAQAAAFAPLPSARVIAESHERSRSFGLQRHASADLQPLAPDALAWAVARNDALCAHALPVMETLSAQIAGTQSMVLLTDAQGVVLHALGDEEFLGRAHRVALRPGGTWSERSKGTNAIGTALALGDAVQVNGDEHFLAANQFLTCSCAPICDPLGQVIGALDVSGDRHQQSAHTLALVRMSARMVENHLFGKVYEDAVRLRFHARPEFLGTLVEGLAAFTPEGRFLAANRSGQFQLGMSANALQAQTFPSLFGMPMSALLAHARGAMPRPLQLALPGGVVVNAMVEFRPKGAAALGWMVQGRDEDAPTAAPAAPASATATRPRPVAPVPAGGPRLSGLRYLDTGDAQLAQVIDRVSRVLGSDVPMLILGETGTGKELLARAIHQDGPRARGPFVAVNCASIPETLIEAELFGYEEGAFTGARRKGSVGKIAQAHGGTLFLDEIGDMPLAMQARLLRVLQERTVAPLGSARQIPVDVHVLCATHRNLRDMMARGVFRDDLYYRLNGLVVRLPALRERSDLRVIVQRLLQAQDRERAAEGSAPGWPRPRRTAPLRVSPRAMELFLRHCWPGNLRQLSNALRTAALMAGDADEIDIGHLPEDLFDEVPPAAASAAPVPAGPQGDAGASVWGTGPCPPGRSAARRPEPAAVRSWDETVEDALRHALSVHGGNVSAVARALGVSRNTVYRRLKAMDGTAAHH